MSTLPSPADPADGARLTGQEVRNPKRTLTGSRGSRLGTRGITGIRASQRYRDRLRLTDALVVAAAVLLSVAVRAAALGTNTIAAESVVDSIGVPLLIVLIWLVALSLLRTRDPHVTGAGAGEYKRVANATAAAFGVLAFVLLLVGIQAPRWYILIALPVGGAGLIASRWFWRRWLQHQRVLGNYVSRAIVVGSLADIAYVVRQVHRHPSAGYQIVGVVSDGVTSSSLALGGNEVAVLGGIDRAAAAAAEAGADAVIVTGDLGEDGERLRRLGWDLEGTGAELVLSSRLTDVAGPRIHFRPVEGMPLLHVEIPEFDGVRHIVKRAFDIAFATVALVVTAPVMLLIAVAILLDDGGPVFFRQTRCGRDGRTFRMLKFRSMAVDAEARLTALRERNDGAGLLFKMRDDPRITRVGRVLRAHSLDELPQFWNILVGDMSVVGPRPPLTSEVDAYDGVVSRRLRIKPGLTGLWQISGRSDLTWEESVRLDLYYVENWSLTGDVMIIVRTIRAVFGADGAY